MASTKNRRFVRDPRVAQISILKVFEGRKSYRGAVRSSTHFGENGNFTENHIFFDQKIIKLWSENRVTVELEG